MLIKVKRVIIGRNYWKNDISCMEQNIRTR